MLAHKIKAFEFAFEEDQGFENACPEDQGFENACPEDQGFENAFILRLEDLLSMMPSTIEKGLGRSQRLHWSEMPALDAESGTDEAK
ncbi:hypothetical protein BY996DRAFT_6495458 [Phakopsora pachyrhizi]|nr:hypothetical protein BY996DRAFT_6495458 [Phakopsora pachyrhizi]